MVTTAALQMSKVFVAGFLLLCFIFAAKPAQAQSTELTEQSGVISSPNYPDNYPNNARYKWTITARENEIIDLRFNSLDLEGASSNVNGQQPSCPDYVRVYDGPTVNSPLMAVMCRIKSQSELARTILRSTGKQMLVVFESDDIGQRSGFVASFWSHVCPEFKYGNEECNQTCNCVADKTVYCNSTNGACVCKPGWGSSDCSQDVDECQNRTVEACPFNYQDCVNTVGSFQCQCKEGLVKNANGSCEVHPGASCQSGNTCSHVCVNIFQGSTSNEKCYCPDNMKLVGNTCQACSNVTFGKDCRLSCSCQASGTKSCDVTTGGCVCSEGWTSSNCSKDIDECNELLTNVCQNPDEQCINRPGGYDCKCKSGNDKPPGGSCRDCAFIITNTSGVIQSPNYPEKTAAGVNCSWMIQAGSGKTVSFRFTDTHIYYESVYREVCHNDAVEIYDGSDARARLLGRFCGSYSDPLVSVQSSSSAMYILFYTRSRSSASSVSNSRLAGAYAVNEFQVSRNNLTGTSGDIISPGYPAAYPHNVYYAWTINVGAGKVVTLNFSDFGLGACGQKYIEIFDGKHTGCDLLQRFCGNHLPTNVFSSERSMHIVYVSLANTTEKGFKARFVENACNCDVHRTQSCKSPTGPCVCEPGYNGARCDQDIDECLQNPNACPAHSTCINSYGSFSCYCWNGTTVNANVTCDDWGKNITDVQGSIHSQRYPNNYPEYVNYTWTITGKPNTVVTFR